MMKEEGEKKKEEHFSLLQKSGRNLAKNTKFGRLSLIENILKNLDPNLKIF